MSAPTRRRGGSAPTDPVGDASHAAGALGVGSLLDVAVEKGVYRGLGLARRAGQVVFVPGGLPGDRLRVRIESVERGYARARTEAVLAPGPGRRPSPCPYVPRCGGCAYQELAYAEQLRLKEQILRESLARAGVVWEGKIPVQGSPEGGWRTRCSFHLQRAGGGLRLGLREEGTHRVVDLERCLQLSDAMNGALRALLAGLAAHPLAGRVRGVEMAESLDGAQLVACLDSDLASREAAALARLADTTPRLTGLGVLTAEAGRRRFVSLRGDPRVDATIVGLRFRSHVRSFFQANRFLVEELVRAVLEATEPGGAVLDLYAGVGLLALPLAGRGEPVEGVEINPTAVEDAVANARRAEIANLRFHRADVLDALARLPPGEPERIVLDPPRTGAGRAVVRALLARRPLSITYVSCDPPTLGRDLRVLLAGGYRLKALRGLDLFPDTFHLETVARLDRL